MPAVVTQGREEGLVDCSAYEFGRPGVVGEDIVDGVGLAFYPEAVVCGDVCGGFVGS